MFYIEASNVTKRDGDQNKIEIILPKIRPLCYGMMRYKPPPLPLFAHSLRYKRFACRASIELKPILWPITFWYWKIWYMNRFYLLHSCPLVLYVALCLPPFNPPSPPPPLDLQILCKCLFKPFGAKKKTSCCPGAPSDSTGPISLFLFAMNSHKMRIWKLLKLK